MREVQTIAERIAESVDSDAKIIFGTSTDKDLKQGELRITLIATDFREGAFEEDQNMSKNAKDKIVQETEEIEEETEEVKESRQPAERLSDYTLSDDDYVDDDLENDILPDEEEEDDEYEDSEKTGWRKLWNRK